MRSTSGAGHQAERGPHWLLDSVLGALLDRDAHVSIDPAFDETRWPLWPFADFFSIGAVFLSVAARQSGSPG
jgi:hypothetical protein